ncbi:hypothetical protein MXD81_65290 [Microbacteriaceae bacterium K1510]|nr:hypothetical protein [Microbacteriaceae bacterium K1510]
MISKRSNAAALAAAIKSNFASTLGDRDRRAPGRDDAAGWTRSTFKAPSDAIVVLRTVALYNGCTMNDLILIAIDDLLKAAGKPRAIAVNGDLRGRIIGAATNKVPPGASS